MNVKETYKALLDELEDAVSFIGDLQFQFRHGGDEEVTAEDVTALEKALELINQAANIAG